MAARLELRRHAVGIELRGGSYDVVVDGGRVASIEPDQTIEASVEPGRHTLQVRRGRYASRELAFDVTDGEVATFRCHSTTIWPMWLVSFAAPRLALSLRRE